jgi:hypothetical protein
MHLFSFSFSLFFPRGCGSEVVLKREGCLTPLKV